MESYVLHAHGGEELCHPPIKLRPGENVIMACNYGCILELKNLSVEFINKHLIRAPSSERFVQLLKTPSIAGKKYDKLSNFFNDILCNFDTTVPELSFNMDASFLTGVFRAPINMPHDKWLKKETSSMPHDRYSHYKPTSSPYIYLSQVIDDLRDRGGGFILFIASCRSLYTYTPPKGIRVRKATLNRPH